jgi:hypothetical protein
MALEIQTAGTGVVRDAHYVTPTGASTPVRTLLLEPQRTNLCIRSEEFDTWTVSSVTVTADNAVAPDGAPTADTLNATAGGGTALRAVTFTGDGEKCAAVFLKAGTAANSAVEIRDAVLNIPRHRVNILWTAGVPSLTTETGGGTRYPVESLGNGWWRVLFSATSIVAANAHVLRVYPGGFLGTGTVLAWGAQAENAVVPSSYIPTEATTVTRNADSLYWDIPALVPRELTVYARQVNLGVQSNSGAIKLIAHIGASNTGSDPRLILNAGSSSAAALASTYDDGTTAVSASTNLSPSPVLFDVLEYRAVLSATWTALVAGSVNGGTEVASAASSASGPAAAFNQSRLWIAGTNADTQPGCYTHVAIALGTKTRAEMRAIAGVP